jgi:hypothetical protein
MLGEKRTSRLDVPRQLRVGETMGRLVRRLAEREQRTIQQEMVILIAKGIEAQCRENGDEVSGLVRQISSDGVR